MEILIFHSHLFELILIPLLGSTKIGAFIGCDLLMLLSNIQLTADVLFFFPRRGCIDFNTVNTPLQ